MSMSDFFTGTMESPFIERESITENKVKPFSAKQAKEEMDKSIINHVNYNIEQAIKEHKYTFDVDMWGFPVDCFDRVRELYNDYEITGCGEVLTFKIK